MNELLARLAEKGTSTKLWVTLLGAGYLFFNGQWELGTALIGGFIGIKGVQNVTGMVKKKPPVVVDYNDDDDWELKEFFIPEEPIKPPQVNENAPEKVSEGDSMDKPEKSQMDFDKMIADNFRGTAPTAEEVRGWFHTQAWKYDLRKIPVDERLDVTLAWLRKEFELTKKSLEEITGYPADEAMKSIDKPYREVVWDIQKYYEDKYGCGAKRTNEFTITQVNNLRGVVRRLNNLYQLQGTGVDYSKVDGYQITPGWIAELGIQVAQNEK